MRLYWAGACLLASFASCAADLWKDDLFSGNGGFWLSRVPVSVTNSSSTIFEGAPVSLGLGADIDLRNATVEELRIVDDDGKELLSGVWSNGELIESGRLPDNAEIVLPVTVPAYGNRNYWLYWGNRSAWRNVEFFKEYPKRIPGLTVKVGGKQHMSVGYSGESAPWPKRNSDVSWLFRVPVRVANFLDEDRPAVLSTFNFHEGVRGVAKPVYRLMDGEREIPLCVIGDMAMYSCSLPAKTVKTLWLYVASDGGKDIQSAPPRNTLGSHIPSDQILRPEISHTDRRKYAVLTSGRVNKLKDSSLTDVKSGWIHSELKDDGQVTYLRSEKGGLIGGFLKIDVGGTENPAWRGWRQTVKIKPSRNYLFGGFIACDESDMRTVIHMHVHDDRGRLSQMAATVSGVDRTSPWTPSYGIIAVADSATQATMHLTTRGRGRFAYDGLLLAEYASSGLGSPQWQKTSVKPQRNPISVQSVDPLVKVFREDPVEDGGDFEIFLARNETESLQLAVRTASDAENIEVEVILPAGGNGQKFFSAETGWVKYVPVDTPSSSSRSDAKAWEVKRPAVPQSSDGWAGMWPDPIVPVKGGTINRGVTQPIWINIKSYEKTPPGMYTGVIQWKISGNVVREDTLKVNVWDFTLPDTAELPAIYDIHWQNERWLKTDFAGLNDKGRREKMWEFYAKMRICPNSIGNNVRFFRDANGDVKADFSEYDKLAEIYFEKFKFPMSYMPNTFLCFGWGRPPTAFMGEQPFEGEWPFADSDRSILRQEYKKAYQTALRLYWNHMKEKGWDDRLVLYISDEPHFSSSAIRQQMKALCRMIHEVDPAIRIYASTWRHYAEWEDSLDVWGAGHFGFFPVAAMRNIVSGGKSFWFTTDGQFCIDTPYCAIERLMPLYCAVYGAEAYENWGSNWHTFNPWESGCHAYIAESDRPGHHYYVRYPNADGYLMYPGIAGRFSGPVSSIRLEAVRDGVEDYSYWKALKRIEASKGPLSKKSSALLAEFEKLVPIPNAGGRYSKRNLPDPRALGILRRKAGDLIERSKH